MTWNRSCAHETRVEGAARSGEWTEDLREHVRTCQACGDLAFVAAALQEDARQSNDVRPLADVGQVWLVAQQQARRATVARATRPIAIIERIAGGWAGRRPVTDLGLADACRVGCTSPTGVGCERKK